ncbi:hypothetical protein MTX78_20430 [Hymenobacter tibetensis]|uniref:HEPN domain-containing protein n=1 Tax=Hymenobacter tibetensis TaxID=497967 RepID=A0ABY4CZS4_9BACT|nr:hypothetical protein [Hymenobacter tibetensis]UOG74474.1 hypothetical protein MTX78_20430 [Hymenobacter tibetensis]
MEKLRVGAAFSKYKPDTRAAPFTVHYTMTALRLKHALLEAKIVFKQRELVKLRH